MFRKYYIFDGSTNFMLKCIWCSSQGTYDEFFSGDIEINADDHFCKILLQTATALHILVIVVNFSFTAVSVSC